MGQFFFDPNDFNVGDGLAELPFEQTIGDSADGFEIVNNGETNVLRVTLNTSRNVTYLLEGVPDTKDATEVFLRAEKTGHSETRIYPVFRDNRDSHRLRLTVRSDGTDPDDAQWLIFTPGDVQIDEWDFGTTANWPISILSSVSGDTVQSKVWDDGSSQGVPVDERTTIDSAIETGTVAGAQGFALGRDGTLDVYFFGVGTVGDEAPQSSEDAGNGLDPAESGTRVNFPSLPATATIVTEGGIDSEDQLVEVSTASGWGAPPFLLAIGDAELFEVALALNIDGTTVTLKRDFVSASTPTSHAQGVAIRPALIGDQFERIYAEFAAIAGVLTGYDAPTYPETNDPNQNWTT